MSEPPSGSAGADASRSRDQRILPLLMATFVGVAMGAAASWPLFFGALDRATPAVDTVMHLVLPALALTGALLLLVGPLTWFAVRRFLGRARGTLGQVTIELAHTSRAVAEGDSVRAITHAEQAVLEGLAWYGPAAARRFVVHAAIALLVAFGGMIGTALLFRQTLLLGAQNKMLGDQVALLNEQNAKVDRQVDLLTEQNRKLDLQTITAEAQRRGPLTGELFAILQEVTRYAPEVGTLPLPRALTARIVAFCRAATPYWVVEMPITAKSSEQPGPPRLADRARSLERGTLLVWLHGVRIDPTPLGEAGATFAGADLRGAILGRAKLGSLDLIGADLRGAFLKFADLSEALLIGGDLTGANLGGAGLSGAHLTRADLTRANLIEADLPRADLTEANLTEAELRKAYLTNANLTGADLTGADLTEADLTGADLTRANLTRAKLTGVTLSGAVLSNTIVDETFVPPNGWTTVHEGPSIRVIRKP